MSHLQSQPCLDGSSIRTHSILVFLILEGLNTVICPSITQLVRVIKEEFAGIRTGFGLLVQLSGGSSLYYLDLPRSWIYMRLYLVYKTVESCQKQSLFREAKAQFWCIILKMWIHYSENLHGTCHKLYPGFVLAKYFQHRYVCQGQLSGHSKFKGFPLWNKKKNTKMNVFIV